MKRIAILSQDGKSDFPQTCTGPWSKFWNELKCPDFEIVSMLEQPEFMVFNNINWRNVFHLFRNADSKKYLVVWEPKVSNWMNYTPIIRRQFDLVILFSAKWKIHGEEATFLWPQNDQIRSISKKQRKNSAVMICSHKMSFLRRELYSQRIASMRQLGKHVEVYGYGWHRTFTQSIKEFIKSFIKAFPHLAISKVILNLHNIFFFPENYKGITDDKLQCLEQYKYAIVIENSPDYVSEKLIDAIQAGCIPLYVGPSLREFQIPEAVAKVVDLEKTTIKDALEELRKNVQVQNKIIEDGRKFIESKDFLEMHSNSAILTALAKLIKEKIEHP